MSILCCRLSPRAMCDYIHAGRHRCDPFLCAAALPSPQASHKQHDLMLDSHRLACMSHVCVRCCARPSSHNGPSEGCAPRGVLCPRWREAHAGTLARHRLNRRPSMLHNGGQRPCFGAALPAMLICLCECPAPTSASAAASALAACSRLMRELGRSGVRQSTRRRHGLSWRRIRRRVVVAVSS